MKTFHSVALAGALALGLGSAAQAQLATIPTPANPTPANPVATNGTPLPVHDQFGNSAGLFSGRSVFAPVGAAVDTGLGTADAIVNGGIGAARDVVR